MRALDPETLRSSVDDALDQAAATYVSSKATLGSTKELLLIAAEFLHHLDITTSIANHVNGPRPVADALCILERHYRSTNGLGIAAVLVDCTGPAGPVEAFLDAFLACVKSAYRQELVRSALTRCIDPVDWAGRLALAEEIMSRTEHWLPEPLRSRSPSQVVGALDQLILGYVEGEHQLQAFFRGVSSGESTPHSIS